MKDKWTRKKNKKHVYRPLNRWKCENDREKKHSTKKADKLKPYDDKDRKRMQKYYFKNRQSRIEYSRKRKRRLYYEVFKIRYQGRCAICGIVDHRVLDFDHLNPDEKVDSISGLVSRGSAWWRIEEEIKKCQLLCANCHRIKTFEQNARYNYEQQFLIERGLLDDPHEFFTKSEMG